MTTPPSPLTTPIDKEQPSSPKPEPAAEKRETEENAELWGNWLNQSFSEMPELLSIRERALPWTGGLSFSNVIHTNTLTYSPQVNRLTFLELIYQHLCSIGMLQTAEILENTSGHKFQKLDQPWEKTDLHLLISMGILPREDPWEIPNEVDHIYPIEPIEEDLFASPYQEDCSLIWKELYDPNLNVVFSSPTEHNMRTMKAASLRRFVVFLANPQSESLSDEDLVKYLLVIHSFTTSYHFFQHLKAIFYVEDLDMSDEVREVLAKRVIDLRSAVINLIKKWLNMHGLFIGRRTIKSMSHLCRRIIDDQQKYASIARYANPILNNIAQLTYGMRQGSANSPKLEPCIPDPMILFRPSLSIIDPEPKEVARQISLIFHTAFKAVHSREFIVAFENQGISPQTPTLSEFFVIGRRLKWQIIEAIALKPTQRIILIILNIAQNLMDFYNFDALAWVVRALRSKSVNRLGLIQEKSVSDTLDNFARAAGENPEDYERYLKAVEYKFSRWEPCIPNIKSEIRYVTIDESPLFYDGLINIEKIRPLADKTTTLYRFQNTAYRYHSIPQIQKMINKGASMHESTIVAKLAEIE